MLSLGPYKVLHHTSVLNYKAQGDRKKEGHMKNADC